MAEKESYERQSREQQEFRDVSLTHCDTEFFLTVSNSLTISRNI